MAGRVDEGGHYEGMGLASDRRSIDASSVKVRLPGNRKTRRLSTLRFPPPSPSPNATYCHTEFDVASTGWEVEDQDGRGGKRHLTCKIF